ncbi:LytR C-terminal domain-containing protein [Demequina aestuarii]|uniref:LytR C-terminal domain-containing protein n=1 Tax=Demequina aestuarii TaxID=327095 RepID=UPI000785A3C1|nr:LytR C-terminal domain-containing protein [Demequina aestuarii]
MPQPYERDEFDEIAAEGGPVGVHRAPRPWWTRVLPPLLAFIIAGAVAFGIATLLWNRDIVGGGDPAPTPTVTVTPTDEPSGAPTASAQPPAESEAPEPSPAPSETEEPEPVILFDAQVHVRNGAGIQGLAGEQQAVLVDAGYTNTEANNISSSLIPDDANVVIYSEERLADTAADVAERLGIDQVEMDDTPGGAEIEVLLASEPGA